MADEKTDYYSFSLGKAIDFASEGLKISVLLNGGAAVALIALVNPETDKLLDLPLVSLAVRSFASGAMWAGIAFLVGYVSQIVFAEHVKKGTKGWLWAAQALRAVTAGAAVWSYYQFYVGLVTASVAIDAPLSP